MINYIKGNYRKSIFQSKDGYNIGLFKVIETNINKDYVGKTITFTGYFHELNEIDTYIFYGNIVNHEKYGEQFQTNSYERVIPEEKDSIIEFLTSGLFKGIGKKKAKAIVDVLGKETLRIILENPNNLLLIEGITENNIKVLHEKLLEYEQSYDTIIYLNDLGFNTKEAMIIYNHYKTKTKEKIENNIYDLIKDIYSLTFRKIDNIALKNNIDKLNINRVNAATIYMMEELSNIYGHSYYYFNELYNIIPRILSTNITEEEFLNNLKVLETNLEIKLVEDKYYLTTMYDDETFIVKRFRMLSREKEITNSKLDLYIKEIEELYNINFNEEQYEAIKSSYTKSFLIITGGPGTGKTTIVKGITELYKQVNKLSYKDMEEQVALLAPTGRAAKRLSEATGLGASTIHRFLKWQKETNKFQINEYNKSKAKFVIIDESSMVDVHLMASLLKGISANARIILVGDDHQLPSVGPGEVLHDLIESKTLNTIYLKELYRQGKDSNIINLAYNIREGIIDNSIFNQTEDLKFIECNNNEIIENILKIVQENKKKSYKDFQILAPIYKTIVGIDVINKEVQEFLNKKSKLKKDINVGEYNYRVNDKVIQLTNMPDENIYNGDIGLINNIQNQTKKSIEIEYDTGLVTYTPTNFNNFKLAYAISIHKSQGSEFDTVVIPLSKFYSKMLYRKLIYTGVTRCKKNLILIGDKDALKDAIMNNSDNFRRTTIKEFLLNGIK